MLDLATAPITDIIADNHQRKVAEPLPLKTTADMFERLAEFANNNCDDDGLDLVIDAVAALTPHLDREVSAMYFDDLMTGIVAYQKAEDGEHPGDVDALTWVEQCRDAVDYTAEKLAGAA